MLVRTSGGFTMKLNGRGKQVAAAAEAMEFLRERPWISVGWHMHFWGSPVLPAEQVPSLIRENGHFLKDVTSNENVNEEEAYAELWAEIVRCINILGRAPDYTIFGARPGTPFGSALTRILKEFNIPGNFVRERMGEVEFPPEANAPKLEFKPPAPKPGEKMPKLPAFPGFAVDPKWESRKIWGTGITSDVFLMTDSVTELYNNYDPLDFYLKELAKEWQSQKQISCAGCSVRRYFRAVYAVRYALRPRCFAQAYCA